MKLYKMKSIYFIQSILIIILLLIDTSCSDKTKSKFNISLKKDHKSKKLGLNEGDQYITNKSINDVFLCAFEIDDKNYLIAKVAQDEKYLIKQKDIIGEEGIIIINIEDDKSSIFIDVYGKDIRGYNHYIFVVPCFRNNNYEANIEK